MVACAVAKRRYVASSVSAGGQCVRVCVADQGRRIPADDLERVRQSHLYPQRMPLGDKQHFAALRFTLRFPLTQEKGNEQSGAHNIRD